MGFFINIDPPSKNNPYANILVRRWDNELQSFIPMIPSDEVAFAEGVLNFDFDGNLGAYPGEHLSHWKSLSNFISPLLVAKVSPLSPGATVLGE